MENVEETLARIEREKRKEFERGRKGGFIMGIVIASVFLFAMFISWKVAFEPMFQYEEISSQGDDKELDGYIGVVEL